MPIDGHIQSPPKEKKQNKIVKKTTKATSLPDKPSPSRSAALKASQHCEISMWLYAIQETTTLFFFKNRMNFLKVV